MTTNHPNELIPRWEKERLISRLYRSKSLLVIHDFITDAENERIRNRILKWTEKRAAEAVGIDPKICAILREENGIGTLGAISDFCDDYLLTDLKKIGQAKAQKIEEAMDAYWEANPRPVTSEDEPGQDETKDWEAMK